MSGSSMEDFKASFFVECEDLLETMQDGFDILVDHAEDLETLNEVFRAVHSIKGGAGAFSLVEVVEFAHQFETALDCLRAGTLKPQASVLALLRQCGDHLSDLIIMAQKADGIPPNSSDDLLNRLGELTGPISGADMTPEFQPLSLDIGSFDECEGGMDCFQVSFRPHPNLFSSGNEPAVLFAALAGRMQTVVTADLEHIPSLVDLDPLISCITWKIDVSDVKDEADIFEVFEFVETACDLEVLPAISKTNVSKECLSEKDGSDLDVSGMPRMPDLADLIDETSAPSQNKVPRSSGPSVLSDHKAKPGAGSIRVDLGRIDKLINLVGELVIKEAILSQCLEVGEASNGREISIALESLKQLAGEIQEGVMAIRAQPLKPMFQRMARVVRDSSLATGKQVRLITIGDTTEVDKTVIERLIDPLTHMLRNAIDHGLEEPQEREKKGKPQEGTVTLSAAHRSGRVVIDVADDGAGINRARVLELAIARNLVSQDEELSTADIDQLLFAPGFSSKEDVSELSGRGVGLDVVRNEIHRLGGRVTIQSDPGEGTTFSISLPLTLAVLDGMVVRVEGQTLVVPISAIRETVQTSEVKLHRLGIDSLVMQGREGLIPVIDLGVSLGFRETFAWYEDRVLLLIASDAGQNFALMVDAIQDQRQVVIKSIEQNYGPISGIAAATILGDGRIALIVDPDRLTEVGSFAEPAKIVTQLVV